MERISIIIITIILIISISSSGLACEKETLIEGQTGETTEKAMADKEAEQSPQSSENGSIEEADTQDVPVVEAALSASYSIKFDATWSSSSHPDNYVSSAHFSPFVAYSYNGTIQGRIFTSDSVATPGMEEMAETGKTGILEEEINQIIEANDVLNYIKAERIDSPGQTEATLEFTQEFSKFIFVSMIAPSPDWFVAAEADLFVDGQWIDQIVLELISFDAGTDSGDSLTAENFDTNPKQPISLFDDSLQRLGTITITKN